MTATKLQWFFFFLASTFALMLPWINITVSPLTRLFLLALLQLTFDFRVMARKVALYILGNK